MPTLLLPLRNTNTIGVGLAVTGLCVVAFTFTANATMQLNTKDEYRGRVMSVYSLVFNGFTPAGTLYAGLITDRFGPRAGFIGCGIIIVLFVVVLNVYSKRSMLVQTSSLHV